jgi:ferrous iron transport protein B
MSSMPSELIKARELTVALAGNPNSGKTSLFNRLTGGHQHVGNYAGVTVEEKWGRLRGANGPMRIVDLPGTYSLNAQSDEERVARSVLLEERTDVVVDVIDTSNLERNLYLAVQLVELEVNLILALNMMDVARGQGQRIDSERLGELMGSQVVETVGHRGGGLDDLKHQMREAALHVSSPRRIDYGSELEDEIEILEELLAGNDLNNYPSRYAAVKLLEGDQEVVKLLAGNCPNWDLIQAALDGATERLEKRFHDPVTILIADRRYGFAAGIAREVTIKKPRLDRVTRSERVDSILAHRLLGLPLFLFFMYGLFWLTFTVGDPLMRGIEFLFEQLSAGISGAWPAGQMAWLHSLIVNGIIGGVGGVLVFLPNIVLLFIGISLLEDTGYMARAAFIMDMVMHKFGLHGKSFIPMIIGFGCTVPAIMATRTLPSKRDRIVTMLILPFISCGARLPIYLLLIPAFFPRTWHAPLLWGLYFTGILLGLLVAKILNKTFLQGEDTPFVMELPPYRKPTLQSILIHMWQRSSLYIRKAGTIILGISILLWVLMSFPVPPLVTEMPENSLDGIEQPVRDLEPVTIGATERLEYSLAGRIGRALEPVMAPLGFDWRINTAFLGAFAAKEVFVAQLGIIFSIGEEGSDNAGLRRVLARNYTPLQGLSILLFALLASPCMATFAITRRESGKTGYAVMQWGGLTALAYFISLVVYQGGLMLGF